MEVLEDHCAAMMFRCFVPGKQEERLFFRFGLLPRFKTRICLDLSLLDNRTIYTHRTPGLLKLVVHGQRTERSQVDRFELGIKGTFHNVKVRMEHFYLSDTEPETYPTPGPEAGRRIRAVEGLFLARKKFPILKNSGESWTGISVLPPTRFLPGTDGAEIPAGS